MPVRASANKRRCNKASMPNKIEARFEKGVLKVTLPKKPEAQKKEREVEIKTG